ncbi:hypothetical protein FJ872_25775 [Mesorhizobium sp. B2-5-9]|uniref:hypothetical protein n=1 Tax=Mesorhizobium sp. B2-5-9 TaxID=2589921 RepID=UPI001128FA64|nr:hypothetical protein [Mesorhizobium sp. B2-5-9]TPK05698.1 hypothetical protein FJ872_25775 [Mesorhizobium sp. B2-5-9]
MNAAQKEHLAALGVASVHDLPPGSNSKLEYANLKDTPDPVSVETGRKYSDGQVQYLSGRSVDDLDDFQRGILAGLGTTTDQTSTAKPSGAPKLDVGKLQASGLTPTARNEILDWFEVLEKADREARSGIPEHLRSTRWDIERAREHVAPYLT